MPRKRTPSYITERSTFAQNLSSLMEERDISHAELGKYLGVSGSAVGYYTVGQSAPSLEKVVKIAEYFDVSTDYLLTGTEIKSKDKDKVFIGEYTGLSEESIDSIVALGHLEGYDEDYDESGELDPTPVESSQMDALNMLLSCATLPDFLASLSALKLSARVLKETLKEKSAAGNHDTLGSYLEDYTEELREYRYQMYNLGESAKQLAESLFQAVSLESEAIRVQHELSSVYFSQIEDACRKRGNKDGEQK